MYHQGSIYVHIIQISHICSVGWKTDLSKPPYREKEREWEGGGDALPNGEMFHISETQSRWIKLSEKVFNGSIPFVGTVLAVSPCYLIQIQLGYVDHDNHALACPTKRIMGVVTVAIGNSLQADDRANFSQYAPELIFSGLEGNVGNYKTRQTRRETLLPPTWYEASTHQRWIA